MSDDHLKQNSPAKTTLDGRVIASAADRFKGHLIDVLCVFPFFIAYIVIMEKILGVIQKGEFFRQPIAVGLYILFLFTFESIFSKTPGKFAFKTIVVNINGNKPKTWSLLLRNICRCIPFDSFTFISDSRGWHDSISKTYVVYSK